MISSTNKKEEGEEQDVDMVLHETLIRLAKGAITAWESWIKNKKKVR